MAVASAGPYAIICTSLQTDDHASTHHSVFTGRMPFLLPHQQRQSTDSLKANCFPVWTICKYTDSPTHTQIYTYTNMHIHSPPWQESSTALKIKHKQYHSWKDEVMTVNWPTTNIHFKTRNLSNLYFYYYNTRTTRGIQKIHRLI